MYWSLRAPDGRTWVLHRHYNMVAAMLLEMAYQLLRTPAQDKPSNQRRALRVIVIARRCMRLRLAQPQRLRALYLFARAWDQLNEPGHALAKVDQALNLASELSDYSALIELFSLRGGLNNAVLRFRRAADDYLQALDLMREYSDVAVHPSTGHEDREAITFQVKTLTQAAGLLAFTGEWNLAERLLTEARMLVARLPVGGHDATRIAYIQAHLDSWNGRPNLALPPGHEAVRYFEDIGDIASASRAHVFTADVAMDWSDRFPEGPRRAALIASAANDTDAALRQARAIEDRNAYELALLLRARRDRYQGSAAFARGRIEEIILHANAQDNVAILAQAFTSLGDELAARKDLVESLDAYRRALSIVEASGLSALGVRARRNLARLPGQ